MNAVAQGMLGQCKKKAAVRFYPGRNMLHGIGRKKCDQHGTEAGDGSGNIVAQRITLVSHQEHGHCAKIAGKPGPGDGVIVMADRILQFVAIAEQAVAGYHCQGQQDPQPTYDLAQCFRGYQPGCFRTRWMHMGLQIKLISQVRLWLVIKK